ncbi:24138_t:CDS:1 [Cetraspora pellucida]|uniref:24138_t:CDS:1 n=1 Tax=Cetraspora pellucida TaxID=1433469 RepID=A0A9N9C8P3_9GLOM|nr:24138_t:CDS:1 [Cetraspora pellucida]
MKIALTVNICTNDGIVNGAQGILHRIIYDIESPIEEIVNIDGEKSITLNKPSKYVIIELLNHKPGAYTNLPPNHVPVYPIKQRCKYKCKIRDGSDITREFQRFQLPVTPAFAITDFKCQGTTLKKVIVDLDGGKIGAGIYVMLSQVQKLNNIMILRPFDQSKLNVTIDPDLKKELKRLESIQK